MPASFIPAFNDLIEETPFMDSNPVSVTMTAVGQGIHKDSV
jgi:hypothetical protein